MTDPTRIAEALTPAQRGRLKRYECGLCELDCYSAAKGYCGGIYSRCSHKTSLERAASCLDAARFEHIREGAATLRRVAAGLEG